MQFWISKFENYINKILCLDEEACYALKKINKKIIALEFENTELKLYITPIENRLSINTECDVDPDVSIKSTLDSFLKTILPLKIQPLILPINMKIVGDTTLARDFQNIISNLKVDFEDPLSKFLGDTLAFQIGRFIRKASSSTFSIVETIMSDTSEYLRFEVEMLPDELLINEFNKEVDCLRDETELISKRIDKINNFLSKNRKNI
jgi:ubiquinone biosynthesis protein UbiJ